MAVGKIMTPGLSQVLEARLTELAEKTGRPATFHIEEAISAYVDRELEMMKAIDEGFEDYANGDVVSHEDVKAMLRATVARHERKT